MNGFASRITYLLYNLYIILRLFYLNLFSNLVYLHFVLIFEPINVLLLSIFEFECVRLLFVCMNVFTFLFGVYQFIFPKCRCVYQFDFWEFECVYLFIFLEFFLVKRAWSINLILTHEPIPTHTCIIKHARWVVSEFGIPRLELNITTQSFIWVVSRLTFLRKCFIMEVMSSILDIN